MSTGRKTRRKEAEMSVANILQGHELLKNLTMEEVERINRFSERRNYGKNETIFRHGEDAAFTYILLSGHVLLRLPSKPDEFRIVISSVEEGEMFGLSPLLGSAKYTAEAQCSVASEVLSIDAAEFRKLLQADCLAGFYIMNEVAQTYFTRYVELLGRLQGIVTQIPVSTSV
jgi:CRP-like cAMP-binding protein